MDYKKEYQVLVNVIKELYPNMTDYQKEKVQGYIESAAENDDEQMREDLIKRFTMFKEHYAQLKIDVFWSGLDVDRVISWLEKQKNIHIPWYDLQKAKAAGFTILKNEDYDNLIKSKEWSEEDERIRSCLIKDCEETLEKLRNDKYGHQEIVSDLKEGQRERIEWLENLNSRSHWKPSEQHMTDLEYIMKYYPNIRGMVESIYKELKKL